MRATEAQTIPRWWLWVPALLAVALVALDQLTDVDRTIVRTAFDAVTGEFPLRDNFWLDVVMHHWTKYAVATVGCLVAGALALTYIVPALALDRRLLLFLVLAIALAPVSVAVTKKTTTRACPFDVEEFGGYVPYTPLLDGRPPGVTLSHCFPAGHASTGFALLAFYFAAHRRRMRIAAPAALAAGIAAGLFLGYGRVLQGAHFPSHVAWCGLLCWMVMVGLYAALFGRPSVVHAERQHAA